MYKEKNRKSLAFISLQIKYQLLFTNCTDSLMLYVKTSVDSLEHAKLSVCIE